MNTLTTTSWPLANATFGNWTALMGDLQEAVVFAAGLSVGKLPMGAIVQLQRK
jgi:hypothetical protein